MQAWTRYNPRSTPRQLLLLNFTSFEMGWGAIAPMHLDGFPLWLERPYSSPLTKLPKHYDDSSSHSCRLTLTSYTLHVL
jgi:hypothetical protein